VNNLHFLQIYFLINLVAYALMWFDKLAAKKSKWRTPEQRLFTIAFALGGLGIFLGTQKPLYHKRAKRNFMLTIYAALVVNLLLAGILFRIFNLF